MTVKELISQLETMLKNGEAEPDAQVVFLSEDRSEAYDLSGAEVLDFDLSDEELELEEGTVLLCA